MAILNTFERYELKYCISKEQANQVLNRIKEYMEPDKYCLDDKYYSTFNIYFDNDQDELINTSLSKPFFKEKLRIRSYNSNASDYSPVFLEIKRKINKVVTKRRAIISYKQAQDIINLGQMPYSPNFVDSQVIKEAKYMIDKYNIYPKVFLRYDRKAFFAKDDPDVRLTFDSNIRARRERLAFDGDDSGALVMPLDKELIEIKFTKNMPKWLIDILTELDIRRTGYTKYGYEYKNNYLPSYLTYTK